MKLTEKNNVVLAYDELQTIYQIKVPTAKDIFGVNNKNEPLIDFEDDVILYKCYRNPREIIVIAHALGFGLYGKRIRQMIKSKEYWRDIGYNVISGELKPGSKVTINRPAENSLESISKKYKIDEIVRTIVCSDFESELKRIAALVNKDIENGLLPEDIMIITVDDRNATSYLNHIEIILAKTYKLQSNNIHTDKFSIRDFQLKDHITLTTVHKAKGNEAYSVYVLGIDALYSLEPTIRERNILFTAMTRSKAWLTLSGLGDAAKVCFDEIDKAKANFPNLKFTYPSKEHIKIMERDIKDKALRKSKTEKMLDELLGELGEDEIKRFISQRKSKKSKRGNLE